MLVNDYLHEVGPVQYGTMQSVHNYESGEVLYGKGIKEAVSSAWGFAKPVVKKALEDPETQKKIDSVVCAGATKLSQAGRSKLQQLLKGGCNSSKVNIGAGMKGRGVKHLL